MAENVAKQIAGLRQLLEATRKGDAIWEESGTPGTYLLARSRSVAHLGVTSDVPPRIRVRYTAQGRPGWDSEVVQEFPDAEPFPDEELRDGLLARLYQLVTGRATRELDAQDAFFADEPTQPPHE